MSASATQCSPPPAHTPLTAVMTGLPTLQCQPVSSRSSVRIVSWNCSTAVAVEIVHVGADLKGPAVAGVHDHAHVGVGVEFGPGPWEFLAHHDVVGVEPLGAVVDDPARPVRGARRSASGMSWRPPRRSASGCQRGGRFSRQARAPSAWSGWLRSRQISSRGVVAGLRQADLQRVPQRLLRRAHRGGGVGGDRGRQASRRRRAVRRRRRRRRRCRAGRRAAAEIRSPLPLNAIRVIASIGDLRSRVMAS